MESIPHGAFKMWSLESGGFHTQVVFRASLAVIYMPVSFTDKVAKTEAVVNG